MIIYEFRYGETQPMQKLSGKIKIVADKDKEYFTLSNYEESVMDRIQVLFNMSYIYMFYSGKIRYSLIRILPVILVIKSSIISIFDVVLNPIIYI